MAAAVWIPAKAGMTVELAGMTGEPTGMTSVNRDGGAAIAPS